MGRRHTSGGRFRASRLDMSGVFQINPGTTVLSLCVLTMFLTILYGVVPSLRGYLVITPATVPNATVSAVWTNPFVATPSSFFGLFLVLGILAYFFWDRVRFWWYRRRTPFVGLTVGGLLLLYGIDRILGSGLGVGMFVSVLMLLWFGSAVESRWGSKRTLIFTLVLITVVNSVACMVAWIWPGSYAALGGRGLSVVNGTGPLVTGFMTVWCLMYGRVRLAIINIEARKLVWVLVILGFLDMAFVGRLSGLMDLMAIAIAWLLISGLWRPRHLLDRIRLKLIENRIKQRRSQIHIVDDDDRRLH